MPQKHPIHIDDLVDVSPDVHTYGRKLEDPRSKSGPASLMPSGFGATDIQNWWRDLDDNQKQSILDNVGEFAGGTAGAIAGGGTPASIVGAGAGAMGGKAIARLAGRAAGIKPTPRTAGQEALDLGKTALVNAAGEGVGRAIPQLAKSLAARGAARIINPNEETVRLMQKGGIDATPGMLSTGKLPKIVERGIGNLPGGMEPIEQATQRAVNQSEANIRGIPARMHSGAVDDQAAATLAGTALEANRSAGRSSFRQRYGEIGKMVGNTEMNVTPVSQWAREVLTGVPKEDLGVFPPKTLATLKQAANFGRPREVKVVAAATTNEAAKSYVEQADAVLRGQGGSGSYQAADSQTQAWIDSVLAKGGVPKPDLAPPTPQPTVRMEKAKPNTFDQHIDLREQVGRAQRALTDRSSGFDRRVIPQLQQSIDKAIDSSLQRTGDADVLQQWRAVNSDYRKFKTSLYGPAAPGAEGNPVSQAIHNARAQPERAISPMTANRTAVQQTQEAVSPSTVAKFGAEPPFDVDAMGAIRRNRIENLVDRSTTGNKFLGTDRYVSPTTLQKNASNPATRELLGSEAPAFDEALAASKAVADPMRLENTSRTALYNKILHAGPVMGGVAAGALTGNDPTDKAVKAAEYGLGMYAIPKLAGKAWTSDAMRKALTGAPPPLAALSKGASGTFYGALGRLGAGQAEPSPSEPEPLDNLESPKKKPIPFSDLHY